MRTSRATCRREGNVYIQIYKIPTQKLKLRIKKMLENNQIINLQAVGNHATQLCGPSHVKKYLKCIDYIKYLLFSGHLDYSGLIDDAGRPVAFLHDADDPRLVALLLLDVLTIGRRLFAGQTDQETARCLSRVSLQQLEHVSARLCHRRHFGDDGQVVDDKRHFVLLV